MDIILHLGAHRTASTSFQSYLRANSAALGAEGIGFWGPLRTRGGLFDGILPGPGLGRAEARLARAGGRLALRREKLAMQGARALIVSDENMIGTMRRNLAARALYRDAGERLARFEMAFDGSVRRVMLSIRSLECYWASTLAYVALRGHGFPDASALDRLVTQSRSWRDVITDVRCAFPGAELLVCTFEATGARPEARLSAMLGGTIRPPMRNARAWANRSPDRAALIAAAQDCGLRPDAPGLGAGDPAAAAGARWMPFDAHQAAALREKYMDDLFWLRAGADGLATLTDDTFAQGPGTDPARARYPGGRRDDRQDRAMAQAR